MKYNILHIPLLLALVATPLGAQTAGNSAPRVIGAYNSYGIAIGDSGFIASTNPGLNEIYLDGYNGESFWHALRYDSNAGTYVQTYASVSYASGIRHLAVENILPAAGDEILVVLENGEIHIHRQGDKKELAVISSGVNNLTGFGLYDFNQDGLSDFAITGSGGLSLFDSGGTLVANYPGLNGNNLVIGQMDADSSPEIAVTNGSVLDVNSGVVQCTWASGFGFELGLSDFDGDGMQELIFSEVWNFAWAFDVDTCLPKWSISLFNVGSIMIGDSDNDGVDELIIGEAQWGDIVSYDLPTQTEQWRIDNPEHGTTSVALIDADQDGVVEILWGAGASSSGEDIMYVGDIASETIEWESIHLDGPFLGPVLGDVDGDGEEEVVTVSYESESGYGAGKIVVLEPGSLVPHISQETLRGLGWTGVHQVKLADVDGDGNDEIVIAGGTTYDGLIEIYDFNGGIFTLVWDNNILPSSVTFYSVEVLDIDGDGTLEVLGGVGAETTGSSGTYIYAYDYATGNEEWHTLQMGGFWDGITEIATGDFDGDGSLEIAGMVNEGDVYIFSNMGTLEAIIPGSFKSMRSGVASAGQAVPLFLGGVNGELERYRFQAGSYSMNANLNLVATPIDGFTVIGSGHLFMGSAGILNLYSLSGGASLIWQSENYGDGFGSNTVRLSNGDFATSGRGGVLLFGQR